MRFIAALSLFILNLSCKDHNNISTQIVRNTTFNLIDSLGGISMHSPAFSDTFFTWIRRSDCGTPCEEGKYRFQQKNLPIFRESGFFWFGEPRDSIHQLTVTHSRNIYIRHNNDSFALQQKKHFLENLKSDPQTLFIIADTVQKIRDRYYAIFRINDFDTSQAVYIRILVAFTSVSGNEIQFRYDLLTKNNDSILANFYQASLKNLESVKIRDAFVQKKQ